MGGDFEDEKVPKQKMRKKEIEGRVDLMCQNMKSGVLATHYLGTDEDKNYVGGEPQHSPGRLVKQPVGTPVRKRTLDGARRIGERDPKRGPHFEKKGPNFEKKGPHFEKRDPILKKGTPF